MDQYSEVFTSRPKIMTVFQELTTQFEFTFFTLIE